MDLNIIYNMIHKASSFEQYMLFNNLIFKLEDEKMLTNSRKNSKIEDVKSGHNKIMNFINRTGK